MTPRSRTIAVAALGLALTAAVAVAKVEQDHSATPPKAPAPQPVHQEPLRAQCWQKGIKIIDEEDLEGLSIAAATRRSTITFKRGDAQATGFLLPLGETLCLLQPER